MTQKKRQSFGFDPDEAPVSGNRENKPRPEELLDVLEMPKGKKGAAAFKQVRPFGTVVVTGVHWIKTKKRDGSIGAFSKSCANFDPTTGRRDKDGGCPWCDAQTKLEGLTKKGDTPFVRFSSDYWINVIDRAAQDSAPAKKPKLDPEERESGVKMKDSDSWTPVRAHRLTGQDLKKVRGLKDLNVVKKGAERVGVSVFDLERGCDINMKFDKEEKVPSNRWTFAISERAPMTEEEQGFLIQDLSQLVDTEFDIKAEKAEVASWMTRMGLAKAKGGDDEDEDEDDEDDAPKRKSSKAVTNDMRKNAKAAVAGLDDDEDEDDEDDEDEPPSKKASAKKPAPKKKIVDDDDDEDGDEEDDEDDEPPAKSKKPAPKKKPVIEDDDEDEDEDDEPPAKKKPAVKGKKKVVEDDDEDEDDEDDEPPARKKAAAKTPVRGKKPVVEDDEDEDDEDEDEDEDDEPPVKKKPAAKPVAKKKPIVEDDDEDEDEDEDEDDEPPARKKKATPPPPPKGKAKKVVDDDDEDDIPF